MPAAELVHETVSTPDTPATVSSTDADAIEAPREGSSRSAAAATTEASNSASAQSGRAGGIPLARVRGLVRDGKTLEPIQRGTVIVTYLLPESAQGWSPPKRPSSAGSTSRSTRGDWGPNGMMDIELDPRGRFEPEFPVGTRIDMVSVAASDHEGMPSTPAQCFVALQKSIDRVLEVGGMDLVLDVERALVFTGVVRDAETHLPLQGATIQSPSSGGETTTQTPSSGPGSRARLARERRSNRQQLEVSQTRAPASTSKWRDPTRDCSRTRHAARHAGRLIAQTRLARRTAVARHC